MAGVVHDEGKKALLQWIFGTTTTCRIRLFKNNITPDSDNQLSDLTEADFAGYAFQNIGALGTLTITGSDNARFPTQTITFTAASPMGSQTIYGYYITILDPGSTARILWSERFPTAQTIVDDGDEVTFDLFGYAGQLTTP